MRVVIAPDKFAGTLTAVEAASAIAAGWARQAPGDDLDLAPMSDGGPGFLSVLQEATGGESQPAVVTGPHGNPVSASWLRVGDTAYVESAQACGLALSAGGDPESASTVGVGELVAAAVDSGVTSVVVGLGGSGTTDGGAGLLAALGATAGSGWLDRGPAGLAEVGAVDLGAARRRVTGVRLVCASDVDNPLTGLFGAAKTYGPQKDLPQDRLPMVDATLERFAAQIDRRRAAEPGAGAAGGIGFALAVLGATRVPGFDLVADAVGLRPRCAEADLVITGEGSFDFSSRSGKVPSGVAAVAESELRPCVVLAGQVQVGAREMRTMGIEAAYSMVELVGEPESFADPAGALARLATRVARTWSR